MNHDRNSDLFDMNNLYLHFGLCVYYTVTGPVYRLNARKTEKPFFPFWKQVLGKICANTRTHTRGSGSLMWPCCDARAYAAVVLTAAAAAMTPLLKHRYFAISFTL